MGLFDRASDAPVDVERLARDVHNALTSLRESIDNKSEDTEHNSRKVLADYETAVAAPRARELAALRRDVDALSKSVSTGAPLDKYGDANWALSGHSRDNPEYRAFFGWLQAKGNESDIKKAELELKSIQTKTLRTDSSPAGGYLVPQVMDATIKKNILEVSPVRAHARLRVMYSKSMDIPRRLSVPIATYEGEAETGPTDQSIYGSEQVTAYRQTLTVPATLDMMVSSAFDLEQEIAYDVGQSLGQGEAKNFVSGNGRLGPQGFIADSRVVPYTTTNSAAINWQDLANIAGQLKHGYQPWFFLNRKTLAYLQGLTSQIGVPIWQPVAGNQPAMIWGYPYDATMIDLDDVTNGSGAKPLVCADLFRGYEIFDLAGSLSVTRDDLTRKKEAITEWTFNRYNTGRVVLPEAIAVMSLK